MKGATSVGVVYFCESDFNPRSREGSDVGQHLRCAEPGISIHAPVKGATGEDQICYLPQGHFNPRSREGGDAGLLPVISQLSNFNPRSREGSDPAKGQAD